MKPEVKQLWTELQAICEIKSFPELRLLQEKAIKLQDSLGFDAELNMLIQTTTGFIWQFDK